MEYRYSVRIVRAVLGSLYQHRRVDPELRADVVQGVNRLPLHFRQVLVLRAQGYTATEIAQRVLGADAWGSEGEWLVQFAESSLIQELNGRGKRDDRGTVSGVGAVCREESWQD